MLSLWNKSDAPSLFGEHPDSKIKNYFDRLFEDSLSTHDLFSSIWMGSGLNRKKNDDGTMIITVDIPGIDEGDINIELKDDMIHVSGQRYTATSSYTINKSFSIPEGYKPEDIRANLQNGVLTLTMAQKQMPTKVEPKKIPITSGLDGMSQGNHQSKQLNQGSQGTNASQDKHGNISPEKHGSYQGNQGKDRDINGGINNNDVNKQGSPSAQYPKNDLNINKDVGNKADQSSKPYVKEGFKDETKSQFTSSV